MLTFAETANPFSFYYVFSNKYITAISLKKKTPSSFYFIVNSAIPNDGRFFLAHPVCKYLCINTFI
jgi:hypothetical protein